MKKIGRGFTVGIVVLMLVLSTFTVGAASTKTLTQKEIDAIVETDLYKNYHQGHMDNIDRTLTEEEYRLEVEKYQKERRKLLKEELDKEVKDGVLTREEADLYLNNFDSMAGYCGSHMMGYHHGNRQTTTTTRNYGNYGQGYGQGYGRGHGGGHGRCHW